jgi:hypothetical protein
LLRLTAARRLRTGSTAGADFRGFRLEDAFPAFPAVFLPVFFFDFFDGFFRAGLVAVGASKSEACEERARTVLDRVAIVVVIPQPFSNGRHSTARLAA